MPVPKWGDFGNIWTTLREVDVNAIRSEAERPLSIACVGHADALPVVDQLLHSHAERYGPVGASPLVLLPLNEAVAAPDTLRRSDMLLLVVDARVSLTQTEADGFNRLEQLAIPFLVVILHGDQVSGMPLPPAVRAYTVAIPDPATLDAPDKLATALLERLPGDLQLSAARRLPGLRACLARELVNNSSFTNATYALASGLPQQVPIFSIPFAAADIIVLTKNQAILVYRLALAYGAPPDFQERIREVIPVVGGAFLWRQAARSLIGLIPVWGIVPKIAVAYAGTYATGIAAWRWYASGELIPTNQLRRVTQEALEMGRARANELVERTRRARAPKAIDQTDTPSAEQSEKTGLFARIRRALPGGRKHHEIPEPNEE